METYKADKKVSAKLKKLLANTIEHHDKYKHSYFWRPAQHASGRRQAERKFPMQAYDIITTAGILHVRPLYRESCKNVYYKLLISLTINGLVNKEDHQCKLHKFGYCNDDIPRDIRAIKNLLS